MKIKTAREIKFRASSMGDIMSGTKKGWSVDDSLTCKRKLIKIFRELKYDRYFDFSNKYTEKGTKMEEDAITLLSLIHGDLYFKNCDRIQNDFWTGECDIKHQRRTIDIKCSWDLSTFPHPEVDKVDEDYIYQGQVYMNLFGADEHTVAYCLVNSPAGLIRKEKENLFYKLNCPDDEDPRYVQGRIDIEKRMIFDMAQFKNDNPHFDIDCDEWDFDIPAEERVVEFTFKRDEKLQQRMIGRVLEARSWMESKLFTQKPNEVAAQ